ncbi:acyl-CoA-binding domain-containing protein 1-like [Zingiber officinale]|uniref:acyl-CoA-binding domain-containing protein 1-like n=1 Tax=Zingiber officinale TaxID=94328 RepID=UPI001C4D06EC|nr:acyl-CoA-binding domain-containing protein 1-like [Zingiber officinale]
MRHPPTDLSILFLDRPPTCAKHRGEVGEEMMEFLEELLLAALISVLLAFIFGNFSADKPEAAEDLGPRPRALNPIQEEKREGKSTIVALGEFCSTDTNPAEVEEGRLGVDVLEKDGGVVAGFYQEKDDLFDRVVGIGRVEDDLAEPGEAKPVEQVVERGGELTGNKEEVCHVDKGKWESLFHGEDEWEGIERSDIEKLFGVASKFVAGKIGGVAVSRLSNEVQMKLYGLHKVATEGPCHEPQPMVLMLSARTKWHSWQELGNISPEAAMEQYINLLTESIPEWKAETSKVEDIGIDANDPPSVDDLSIGQLGSKSSHSKSGSEIVTEDLSAEDVTGNVETGPKLLKQGLANILLFNLISPPRVAF